MGNRVWKYSNDGGVAEANYIVDISGPLPVILCEIDDTGEMTNSYIYADGRILAKCDHTGVSVEDYFYITDRSGSVRVIADDSGAAQVSYTYDPFGVVIEENDNGNPFENPSPS